MRRGGEGAGGRGRRRESKGEGEKETGLANLEHTLCRLRQCSSATNWWKLLSVTFSVSSKDNKGFCKWEGEDTVTQST